MSTGTYTLPDGEYVIPVHLWYNNVHQSLSARRFADGTSVVRVHVVNGEIAARNCATIPYWYRNTPDGRRQSKGHAFIDTEDDLKALCNALPFSWRE